MLYRLSLSSGLHHPFLRLPWKIIHQHLFTVQMDSGFGIQSTCCCESSESPQASVAKIRNSVSPGTPAINHTSVTARGRGGGREWGCAKGCAAPLNVETLEADSDIVLEMVLSSELLQDKTGLHYHFEFKIKPTNAASVYILSYILPHLMLLPYLCCVHDSRKVKNPNLQLIYCWMLDICMQYIIS